MRGNTYRAALLRLVETAIAEEAEEQQRSRERTVVLRQMAGDLQAGRAPAELTIGEIRRRARHPQPAA